MAENRIALSLSQVEAVNKYVESLAIKSDTIAQKKLNCTICLQQLSTEEQVARLECNELHCLHLQCAKDWM